MLRTVAIDMNSNRRRTEPLTAAINTRAGVEKSLLVWWV
jgi:hypothetical protein